MPRGRGKNTDGVIGSVKEEKGVLEEITGGWNIRVPLFEKEAGMGSNIWEMTAGYGESPMYTSSQKTSGQGVEDKLYIFLITGLNPPDQKGKSSVEEEGAKVSPLWAGINGISQKKGGLWF